MAFIRWKKNKFGIRQAYLIHSYRDEQGKPKHKTLAYLGREGDLTPAKLSLLKEKHQDLKIQWHKIQASAHPAPLSDISHLSNLELARSLRDLRRERGMNIKIMFGKLLAVGAPPIKDMNKLKPLDLALYRWLERGWQSSSHPTFLEAAEMLGPYIRRALGL